MEKVPVVRTTSPLIEEQTKQGKFSDTCFIGEKPDGEVHSGRVGKVKKIFKQVR
jgi:hypothetical protein